MGLVDKWNELDEQEGEHDALRNSVLDLLLARFNTDPTVVADRLAKISDVEKLRELHFQATMAESLTDFEEYLDII
ncbi:MAG: hypothetical protein WAM60_24310 [Candidatus Promineifilaceae bacterium]